MKILITGTAGFIGFHLAKRLCDRGEEVIGLDNINDYYDRNIKYGRLKFSGIIDSLNDGGSIKYNNLISSKKYSNYQFIKLDMTDRENLEKLFKEEKFDTVMNLAAQAGVRHSLTNPYDYIDSNIVGFVNLLENSRKYNVENFGYASSSSVYGLNEVLPFSTAHNTNHPMSLYAASKKSNELMAHSYSHLYALKTTGLRFFTAYGPWGRPDMALFLFTKAALEDKSINVFNYGDMLRDFTYIDDIIDGIVKVVDKPATKDSNWNGIDINPATSSAPFAIYNLGNNSPVKLMDYIKAIEKKLCKKIEKNMVPMQLGDVPFAYADISESVRQLDYKSTVSVQAGINNFIDWYIDFFQKEL